MMPSLFVGHGSPENAIEDNDFTRAWKKLADRMPRPKAILCISAHWLKEGTAVTCSGHPQTIHDFYGFPKELYKVEYNVLGSPELAGHIKQLVKTTEVYMDNEWGIDHGTWSVLLNMYPKADFPVLQLSLDYHLPFEKQYKIGIELSPLRNEGVLVMGSGNLVHNLMVMDPSARPYDFAVDFDLFVKNSLETRDDASLINFTAHRSWLSAHPTYDHYLPLLYVMGASRGERPQFFNDKIVFGAVSMRCAAFGAEGLMC
jgi:4,5-DOPA dioxygenase extradiol